VPVLVTGEGKTLSDSADIVRFADERASAGRRLYPAEVEARDQVLALEKEYAGALGVEARRIMYHHFFSWGRPALGFTGGRAPFWERWALYAAFPLARRHALTHLNVSPETVRDATSLVQRTFDEVADQLSDGRRYLIGDQFTAADLTFACMAAAVTAPEDYGVPLPAIEEVPTETGELLRHFRQHPAGQFALRMFTDHRRAKQ
jgi:glutathione S-transferase